MTRNSSPQQTLQQLPKKWAVGIVIALIAYALVQPLVNSRLGWGLPSLAGLLGREQATAKKSEETKSNRESNLASRNQAEEGSSRNTVPNNSAESGSESEVASPSESNLESAAEYEPTVTDTKTPSSSQKQVASDSKQPASKSADSQTPSKTTDSKQSAGKTQTSGTGTSKPTGSQQAKPDASADLLYGLLKDTGREVYVSPAGLRYTRGSEEGHRLKHLEKHLKDIPDRPGKHGVFDGDMGQALRWIDDAYTRGKQGAKGVRKREEDGRTVYEVPFTKPIGYIGGRDGKRDNNPDAKRLRLVVDGDQVITAFPF